MGTNHTEITVSSDLGPILGQIDKRAETDPYIGSALKVFVNLSSLGYCRMLKKKFIQIKHPHYLPLEDMITIGGTKRDRKGTLEEMEQKEEIFLSPSFKDLLEKCSGKKIPGEVLRLDMFLHEKDSYSAMEEMGIKPIIPEFVVERTIQLTKTGFLKAHPATTIIGFCDGKVVFAFYRKGVVKVDTRSLVKFSARVAILGKDSM
jgi:hypothetical protein